MGLKDKRIINATIGSVMIVGVIFYILHLIRNLGIMDIIFVMAFYVSLILGLSLENFRNETTKTRFGHVNKYSIFLQFLLKYEGFISAVLFITMIGYSVILVIKLMYWITSCIIYFYSIEIEESTWMIR